MLKIIMLFLYYDIFITTYALEDDTLTRFHDEYTSHRHYEDFSNLPRNGELFEGDIIMDSYLRRAIYGEKSKKSALRNLGIFDKLWHNGIVFYSIDFSLTPRNHITLIRAIKEFEKRTCIRFRKRKREYDYVVFTSRHDGCFSYIGRRGGRQILNVGKRCRKLGTYEHEIMHALGIVHEHSRADRDDYIKINFKNIKSKNLRNFQKYDYYQTDNLNVQFNYASVMLYPNYAFSKNGKDTIMAVSQPGLKFGQRKQFSVSDVKQINRLYRCKEKSTSYEGLVSDIHATAKSIGHKNIFERTMMRLQNFLDGFNLIFLF